MTYTDPMTRDYWLRVRAALKFCEGFDQEALTGSSLGDVMSELRRLHDHLATWTADHSHECTAEIDAALHCAGSLLYRLQPDKE